MLTLADLQTILARICYRTWQFNAGRMEDGYFVQARFVGNSGEVQHGRKWYVSRHACESEVVQTVLLAILTAEEHESRESFTLDDVAIFSPHFDVNAFKHLVHQTREAA